MKTRAAVTLLTSALALGASGVAGATDVAPAQATLLHSQTALSHSLAQGDLEQRLTAALETTPSQTEVLGFQQALASLAVTSPADAAAACQAVVNSAWTTAASNPQLGVDIAALAVSVLNNPSIAKAVPETAAQSLADVHGAVALAERVAEGRGITLTGTDVVHQARDLALANEATKVVADFDVLMMDAVALAEAQAELSDFDTAAFPVGFFDRARPVASPAEFSAAFF